MSYQHPPGHKPVYKASGVAASSASSASLAQYVAHNSQNQSGKRCTSRLSIVSQADVMRSSGSNGFSPMPGSAAAVPASPVVLPTFHTTTYADPEEVQLLKPGSPSSSVDAGTPKARAGKRVWLPCGADFPGVLAPMISGADARPFPRALLSPRQAGRTPEAPACRGSGGAS